ncbi:AraC family transcriptional regulator [Lachnospiraceae bacterium ASD3451]|uniref:AraC family transcriptional regulator n=1 Tax=Diplocloster agilis TaxID=2850323 RepID=UPI001DB11FD1|nr:AraC family transcriptional regulator [Diplocloster agilis]MBU9744396.1 AraC family transcriptional regulator [Diplocloster agilis]
MIDPDVLEKLTIYSRMEQKKAQEKGLHRAPIIGEQDIFGDDDSIFINLHLYNGAAKDAEPDHFHGHDFFELVYVVRGQCTQFVNNNSVKTVLDEGTLSLLNPNAKHCLMTELDNSIIVNILLKKGLFNATFWPLISEQQSISNFFMSYFFAPENTNDFSLIRADHKESLDGIVGYICREYIQRKLYYKNTLSCLLSIFFAEVIRNKRRDPYPDNADRKESAKVSGIVNYLCVNYATATLSSAANYFNYTPSYFSAYIKRHTGRTFRSLINEIRMSYTNYYLSSTSLALKDVSEILGFTQICNFYEFVRKNYESTPGELRMRLSGRR